MRFKLSVADYTFPLLGWKQSLRLARDLGIEGIDIALFENGSHLRPHTILSNPIASAATVLEELTESNLILSDIFGIPGTTFEHNAVNHPDMEVRRESAEYFHRMLEFTVRCGASHLTLIPGIDFPSESPEDSLLRASEELEWRAQTANKAGVQFAIEPHFGSVASTPAKTLRLLTLAPSLTLSLDPAHFIYQGFLDQDVLPLIPRTSHFHARCARKGRLQAPMKENTIDFFRYLDTFEQYRYAGWIALEYVWMEWEYCNEVDNISETVLLRELLLSDRIQNDIRVSKEN
jgi:sugar phosphate isomerase/epimerase